MKKHGVVVAGGGPTGLMLAGELALAGVDVALVERRTTQDLVGARAGGLQSRSLEILDQRGIADRFLAEGQVAQTTGFGGVKLDISHFPTRFPYGLALWQKHIERILAGWIAELPVTCYRGKEFASFTQDDAGVTIELAEGDRLWARYLVGCDGGRSAVRKMAGIDFPGWAPTMSSIIGEVESRETPPLGVHQSPLGTYGFGRLHYDIVDGKVVFRDEGPLRVMVPESDLAATREPTLDDLRTALIAVAGTDYGIHSPILISRFTDATRQAATYRSGRILLAGDAAHIHSPVGGQGLNTGLQDAMNLGWKLGQVLNGWADERLLDTYHAERHPVGARVLQTTMAQVALQREDDRSRAVRAMVGEWLSSDEPRLRMAGELSGLGIHYDLAPEQPLVGRRMPDIDLTVDGTSTRLFAFLHDGRPILLTRPGMDSTGWSDRVKLVVATYGDDLELPVIGKVTAPGMILIRPDGYVGWAGDRLSSAVTKEFTDTQLAVIKNLVQLPPYER